MEMGVKEELLKWSSRLHTGIAEIDAQHRQLVDLLNKLYRSIGEKQGGAESRRILGELIACTETHFALEEALMRAMKYSGLKEHQDHHEALLVQVRIVRKRVEEETGVIGIEQLHFLRAWLARHINESDRNFGTYFALIDDAAIYEKWLKTVDKRKAGKPAWKFW
jgi:hemerythrin